MSGNLEIREGDSNETVRAGQDLETIWSNPEMLSDLPSIAQQALGFDPALSTFPFLGGFLFLFFFFGFGDWSFARWRFRLAKLYGQMGQRKQHKRNGMAG